MPTFKATFVFEDTFSKTGFTHTWWTTADNHLDASNLVAPYWTQLRLLVSNKIFFRFFRVSDVDALRDSRYFPVPASPNNAGAIDPAAVPIVSYTEALLVRRDRGEGDIFSKSFLHGVPVAIFDGRDYPGTTPPAGWTVNFDALVTEVTGGNYLLRKKNGPGAYVYLACDEYVAIGETSRRVGRPFDRLRGRRRTG